MIDSRYLYTITIEYLFNWFFFQLLSNKISQYFFLHDQWKTDDSLRTREEKGGWMEIQRWVCRSPQRRWLDWVPILEWQRKTSWKKVHSEIFWWMKLPCETMISAFQRCVTWGEKTLDQWVYFFLKLVENFKMAYLVGACEVFSSAVLSLDSVMGKE